MIALGLLVSARPWMTSTLTVSLRFAVLCASADGLAEFATARTDNRRSGSLDMSRLVSDEGLASASSMLDNQQPSRGMGSLSTGTFRAEAHSDWLVEFKDLVCASLERL